MSRFVVPIFNPADPNNPTDTEINGLDDQVAVYGGAIAAVAHFLGVQVTLPERSPLMDDDIRAAAAADNEIDQAVITQAEQVQRVIRYQWIMNLQNETAQLTVIANGLSPHLPMPVAPVPAPVPVPRLKVALPEKYLGQDGEAPRIFITSCETYMGIRAAEFPNDDTKIGWALMLMSGDASTWAQMMREERIAPVTPTTPPSLHNWAAFVDVFKTVFFDKNEANSAQYKLSMLQQGSGTVREYSLEFHRLVIRSGYSTITFAAPLISQFKRGLKRNIYMELVKARQPANATFADVMNLAIELDDAIRNAEATFRLAHPDPRPTPRPAPRPQYNQVAAPAPAHVPAPAPVPAYVAPAAQPAVQYGAGQGPMELDRTYTRLSEAEKQRLRANDGCFYCRRMRAGHNAANCPNRPPRQQPRRAAVNAVEADPHEVAQIALANAAPQPHVPLAPPVPVPHAAAAPAAPMPRFV